MRQFIIYFDLTIHSAGFIVEYDNNDGISYRYHKPIRNEDVEDYSYYGDGPWLTSSGSVDAHFNANFMVSVREDHLVSTLKELVNLFGGQAQLVEVMS